MNTQYQMVRASLNSINANAKGLSSEELEPLLLEFVSRLFGYLHYLLEPGKSPKACTKLDGIQNQLHHLIKNNDLKSSESLTLETISLVTLQIAIMKIAALQNLPIDQIFNSVLSQTCKNTDDPDLLTGAYELLETVNHFIKPKYPVIIVVEGAEDSLKVDLVEKLSKRFNACVIDGEIKHHTLDQDQNILGNVNTALSVLAEHNNMVIIHESYLTEFAYSTTKSEGEMWRGLHRAVHDGLQSLNAVFIICGLSFETEANSVSEDWIQSISNSGNLSDIGPGMQLQHFLSYDENSDDFIDGQLLPLVKDVLGQS